jgi:glucose-6-phosphate isomerase
MDIKLDITKALSFTDSATLKTLGDKAEIANRMLHEKTGKGNDFTGWVNLPSSLDRKLVSELTATGQRLRELCDVVIVIGIGGSYLGAKAVLDALNPFFDSARAATEVVFAGHHLDEDYLSELLEYVSDKNVGCIVISKSGTTTEPAVAFRLVKRFIVEKYGAGGAQQRIVAITDKSRGALREMSEREGYQTYVIPDDVGGRFSVLTPVGLLPVAVAGFDIERLLDGAVELEKASGTGVAVADNICAQYAVVRNALYSGGKKIEILANFNPRLHYLTEWWKQLYGESEGKENKGIFPAGVDLTSDLHSMGQYIQEGERILFETVVSVAMPARTLAVPHDSDDYDKLNYLEGKRVSEVNCMAELGTILAHVDGGVPNIRIEIPALNEFYLGQLIYFFEKACGISGYLLGVNPFDQPGVEAYKKNMFSLLGKPGSAPITVK